MAQHSTSDDLRLFYSHPGPYVTLYAAEDTGDPGTTGRFERLMDDARAQGATDASIEAVEARLSLPVEPHTGARAIVASANGSTFVDQAHEGPDNDLIFVGSLPYVAPLLEWEQWRVPHLAVMATTDTFEVVSFVPGSEPSITSIGPGVDEAATALATVCREPVPIELVTIAGHVERASALRIALAGALPINTDVVVLEDAPPDAAADAVVRAVADKVARGTVAALREFRFLLGHEGAVHGVDAAVEAMAGGNADMLLIHDDPDDQRRAFFGPAATDVSLVETERCTTEGRLVDVMLRSAVLQGATVRIIPSTGTHGPADDVAVLFRDPVARVDEFGQSLRTPQAS